MTRGRQGCGPWIATLVLAGCAANAVHVGAFDPGQLVAPGTSAVAKDRARVAAGVAPAELDRTYVGVPTMRQMLQVNLPLGRIVDGAASAAFEREFETGVPGQPPSRPLLRVEIDAPRFEIRDDVPAEGRSPFLPRYDLCGRMTFELRVVDANGIERWSRDYDAGWQVWVPPPPAVAGSPRPSDPGAWGEGLQKMAHEQASRLTSQAARDVRGWVQSERIRERSL